MLTDITFTVSRGQRLALIGENGVGKSTLLRIAAGVEPHDAGSVIRPGRIGLLWQEPAFALTDSIGEVINQALDGPRAILREFEDATVTLEKGVAGSAERYDRALEAATRHDVWDLDRRVETTLAGVGLPRLDRGRPAGDLSGGQRSRLSLAWLLLNRPDTILLDEPTNHLDDAGVDFLSASLANWPGPVLFASHDRAFIDCTATGIIDLDPHPQPKAIVESAGSEGPTSGIGCTQFAGTFTDYLHARQKRRERWQQQYENEQDQLKDLERRAQESHVVGHTGARRRTEARSAKKFYSDRNANVVSRRVSDLNRRLEELRQNQIRKPPPPLEFQGLQVDRKSQHSTPATILVSASEAAVDGRLGPVSLTVGGNDRLLVTGPNGTGKSTLLAILAGQLQPSAGVVNVAPTVTVGYLPQDVSLNADLTVNHYYSSIVGAERAKKIPLDAFGLVDPRDMTRRVGTLSVGQQRRLALATTLAPQPDLLILDEPTNHLSLALTTALEKELPNYSGAIVVASHDRWLRESWDAQYIELDREDEH